MEKIISLIIKLGVAKYKNIPTRSKKKNGVAMATYPLH